MKTQEVSQESETLTELDHDSSWRDMNESFIDLSIQRLKEMTQHGELLQAASNSWISGEIQMNCWWIVVFKGVFFE